MIRTIIGRRGYGKTTLAGKFLDQRTQPAIIVDMLGQFKHGKRFFSAKDLLDHILTKKISITDPLILGSFELNDFSIICEIAIRLKNVMLIIDEVDFFDSPRVQDKNFKRVIHYGRHYNIDLVTTSRRPANISRDLTSQTDEFYVFRVTEKRDLEYFENLSSELPELIRGLPKYSYLKYNYEEIITLR
ncbi:MAG: ATP-binding protein [Nitrospirae bacterium]|nr:ATP-binding protein [Nitrospirota bacterium]